MARPLPPIVAVILAALRAEGAHVQVTRFDQQHLNVDLDLRSRDGRRVIVNIREARP